MIEDEPKPLAELLVSQQSEWTIENGWLSNVDIEKSNHCEPRDTNESVSLLVVHNISLPPAQFGGGYITDLFLGRLDPSVDPYFADIYQLRVSAH